MKPGCTILNHRRRGNQWNDAMQTHCVASRKNDGYSVVRLRRILACWTSCHHHQFWRVCDNPKETWRSTMSRSTIAAKAGCFSVAWQLPDPYKSQNHQRDKRTWMENIETLILQSWSGTVRDYHLWINWRNLFANRGLKITSSWTVLNTDSDVPIQTSTVQVYRPQFQGGVIPLKGP